MTKRQFIDLLKHKLAGGDCPQELKGKYHPEIISKHLSMAFNHAVNRKYEQGVKKGNFDYLDAFTKTYSNIAIEEDETRDEKYSVIPKSYMTLPKNRGVRLVYPGSAVDRFFRYRANNRQTIMSMLDISQQAMHASFYVEGEKVWFWNIGDYDSVTMKIVVSFDKLDDDDEVPIPMGYEKVIFDLVFQTMAELPPEKLTNDENSKVR
jgi:hypothetical protein